jgi:dienelactone hydrolase
VSEHGLVGTLFLPQEDGPVGAIIVLGGSSGGRKNGIAALLASHGFVTLALAYFRDESLPKELAEIPLEYFETAMEFLAEQVTVDAARIAVWGASRGAELALLLGATFPRMCAVVAYAPGSLVFSGCCSPQANQKAAWTYGGRPIVPLKNNWSEPEIQALRKEIEDEIKAGKPAALTRGFRLRVAKALNLEESTIPVEKIRGPILLISGKEDALWPSAELAEIAMSRLREHRFADRFEHLSYEDAGHQIWIPFLPTTVSSRKHPLSGIVIEYGGTPAGIAKASADSWPRVLEFYREALGRGEE